MRSERRLVFLDADVLAAPLTRTVILMAAVHPDQYLATVLTSGVYEKTLTGICANRTREPNTPARLHAALAREHPRLVAAMETVFPGVEPEKSMHGQPTEVFRGVRCIKCQDEVAPTGVLVGGVGPSCRLADSPR